MKTLLIICTIIFFGIKAEAQATNDTIYEVGVTPPPFVRAREVKNHVGATLVVCDKVYSYKVINDRIKSLSVGAGDPDQLITIVLMGACYKLDVEKMIDQKICFKGVVSLRAGKTHMIISKLDQIKGYERYE